VVDGDPFELRRQIALHGRHERTGEVAQITELDSVFGGDDEAKLVAVLASPGGEFVPVGGVRVCSIGLRRLAVVSYPVSGDVAQVCGNGLWAALLHLNDPGLDHYAA
jgi:hypothetical protein